MSGVQLILMNLKLRLLSSLFLLLLDLNDTIEPRKPQTHADQAKA